MMAETRVGPDGRVTFRDEASPRCPRCGKILSAHAHVDAGDHPPPAPGDWTVCTYCSAGLVFTDGPGRLRFPTLDEQAAMDRNPDVQRWRLAAQITAREWAHRQ